MSVSSECPLLFILYVNDLPEKVGCGMQMFVDIGSCWY